MWQDLLSSCFIYLKGFPKMPSACSEYDNSQNRLILKSGAVTLWKLIWPLFTEHFCFKRPKLLQFHMQWKYQSAVLTNVYYDNRKQSNVCINESVPAILIVRKASEVSGSHCSHRTQRYRLQAWQHLRWPREHFCDICLCMEYSSS